MTLASRTVFICVLVGGGWRREKEIEEREEKGEKIERERKKEVSKGKRKKEVERQKKKSSPHVPQQRLVTQRRPVRLDRLDERESRRPRVRPSGRQRRGVRGDLLVPRRRDPDDKSTGGSLVGSRLVLILLLPVDGGVAGLGPELEVERGARVAAVEEAVEPGSRRQRADEGQVQFLVQNHAPTGARVLEVAGADRLREAVGLVLEGSEWWGWWGWRWRKGERKREKERGELKKEEKEEKTKV